MFKAALIVLLTLGAVGSGCNTYEPVRFSVRDAETGEPVPKAEIGVHYLYYLDPFHPRDASAIADAQGEAVIKTSRYIHIVDVSAEGFIPFNMWLDGRHDDAREFWLYRLPRPTVEVVIPKGYRGLLTVTKEPADSRIQETPGKRHFVFHASREGAVDIKATPLLRDDFRWQLPLPVRYEDGQRVPDRDDLSVNAVGVAVRFIGGGQENQLLYVIGDEQDQKRIEERLGNE